MTTNKDVVRNKVITKKSVVDTRVTGSSEVQERASLRAIIGQNYFWPCHWSIFTLAITGKTQQYICKKIGKQFNKCRTTKQKSVCEKVNCFSHSTNTFNMMYNIHTFLYVNYFANSYITLMGGSFRILEGIILQSSVQSLFCLS